MLLIKIGQSKRRIDGIPRVSRSENNLEQASNDYM